MSTMNGSCLCGAITIKVNAENATPYLCHCKNCRKACGSLFSHNMLVKDSQVETPLTKGFTFVKLGNFETAPAPIFEAYVKDRYSFEKAWEGIGQFDVNAPTDGD